MSRNAYLYDKKCDFNEAYNLRKGREKVEGEMEKRSGY